MTCDYCKKIAKWNVQENICVYPVDKNENYGKPDIQDNTGLNMHLCDKHKDDWDEGRLDTF